MIELIEPQETKVAVYAPIEAGIALLMEKHGSVLTTPPDVSTPTAMDKTKANRRELVKFRTAIEAARKAEKEASLVYGRLVDSEAKRITAIAAPIEQAYDSAITAEESRLEAIRQAELEAERRRIAGHLTRIQAIKDVREAASLCRTTEQLKKLIDGMPAMVVQSFEEFDGEAMTAFNEVCTLLAQLHGVKAEQEKAAAELAQQQAELARQQAEQARLDRDRAAEAAVLKERADALAQREAEMARREALAAAAVKPVAETEPLYEDGPVWPGSSAVEKHIYGNGAPMFGATTFKENGDPIMLDDQGRRSVFCDVDEDGLDWGDLDEPSAPVADTPVLTKAIVANIARNLKADRDDKIIEVLAMHFRIHESMVLAWLMDMDFEAAGRRIESEFTGV